MSIRFDKSLAAAAVLAVPLLASAALESYATYDLFPGSGPIDNTKWSTFERSRAVKSGAMNLVQRDWGGTFSDAGILAQSWGDDIAAPGHVTQLKATLKVNAFETTGCTNNVSPGYVRARLVGTFFNTGNPTSGNYIGDIIVQARVGRLSNSNDAAGVLRVQGLASVCLNADCSSTTLLGSVVDLGTATTGQSVTLAIEWLKSAKKFTFSRDEGANTGEVAYTVSDAAGPARPLQAIGNRIDVANCQSGPRTTGMMDASFDVIQVNKYTRP